MKRRNVLQRLAVLPVTAGAAVLALATGAAAAPATTVRVSVPNAGGQADAVSLAPALSADGRFVAFSSDATNLVPGDTNGASDVFLRDRRTGTTQRVSVGTDGSQGDAESGTYGRASISADGRYVVFASAASTFFPGDTMYSQDVFVRDVVAGTTTLVSVARSGGRASGDSLSPSISADGRYVVFESDAPDLAPGDTNATEDVFGRDLQTRVTTLVSRPNGGGGNGNGSSYVPSVSGDGRLVAFMSGATNLVAGDTNGVDDVFVRDRRAGTTRRVNVTTGGKQALQYRSLLPQISANGRYVGYSSYAGNLVPGDTNRRGDAFVRDLARATTRRVSVSGSGAQGNDLSYLEAISADGRYVALSSRAGNLAPRDTNGASDVFLRDVRAGTTRLVSRGPDGLAAGGFGADVSDDGQRVAFSSDATDLVPDDSNGVRDIFVRVLP